MFGNKKLNKVSSIVFVICLNVLQLLQALSFLNKAPKENKWNSDIEKFIESCKILALRFDSTGFIVLYITFSSICAATVFLYIAFYDQVHSKNQNFSIFSLFLRFIEYFVFVLGFVPMASKFIEVQFCSDEYKVKNFSQVDCFKKDQMLMLQIGFVCIGVTFVVNSIVIPALRHERNGIEQLWSKENYFEGLYYLLLFSAVSFIGFIEKPWVGILLCGLGYMYGIVFECYKSLWVACSRCAVLFSLAWAYTAAHILGFDSNTGNYFFYFIPAGYSIGFALRFLKGSLKNFRFNKVKSS